MKKYEISTMAQDLKRAKGKKPKPLEIEIKPEKKEARSKLKPQPEKKERKKKPQLKMKEEKGGFLKAEKKKPVKKGKFSLTFPSILKSKKTVAFLIFVLLFGLGGFFYFNFFSKAGFDLGQALQFLPETVREFLGLSAKPSSGNLRVVKPNGGEQWQVGETHKILWFSKSPPDWKVRISYTNQATTSVIAEGVPNTGKYSWTIPKDMQEGGGYKINISFTKAKASDESDGVFTIKGEKEEEEKEEYDVSPALIDVAGKKTIKLESEEELKNALKKEAGKEFGVRTFRRLIFILPDLGREMSPSEIFYYIGWGVPDSILPFLGLDYNLFLYNQKELFTYKKTKRLALIFRVNQPQLLAKKLIESEKTLKNSLLPGFFLDIEAGQPLTEDFLVNSKSYPKVPIKYQNYPQPDLSIDYAIASLNQKEGFLLLSSSRESMYKLIDGLQKKWELQTFHLPEVEQEAKASIKGKVCYPAGGIPEDWTPWAKNLETGQTYQGQIIDDHFIIKNLPLGDYHVYAKAQDLEGRYTQAVVCGLTAQCTDHSFVKVTITKEEVADNIDPCDWYYGQ